MSGLEAEQRLLFPAAPEWPPVRIVVDPGVAHPAGFALDGDSARYPDGPTRRVEIDRAAGVATFRGAGQLTSDEIVHPRLGMLAAVYAQWLPGRMAFHAGAFVSGHGAWAVVGKRGDGKSTLVAALALAGVPVLCDDTLVVEGERCLPGVRCVDLRADAAAQLGVGHAVVTVRRSARDRFLLDEPPRGERLAGWFFLSWADELAVRELPAQERLLRIATTRLWHRRGVTDPSRLLDIAALPAWELSRPRDWAQLPRVLDRVRELTSG